MGDGEPHPKPGPTGSRHPRFCSSFPRTRALLYFGEAEHPGPFVRERLKSLDSRVRWNDEQKRRGL
ncbi:hypothetical protein [Lysobacter gummosus]|uniref:hypothetical protein n=1 Tax=Lysobacter gummosus TaxID=262324 RepID=UPI0036436DC5